MPYRSVSAHSGQYRGRTRIILLFCALLFSIKAWGEPVYLIATLTGEQPESHFGRSVGCSDLNADGYDDIIVGAPQWTAPDSIVKGRAYIYYGGPEIDSIPDIVLTGYDPSQGQYGASVSGTRDVNADGYDDIVIGDPWRTYNPAPFAGKAYIYFGGSPPDTIPDITFAEPQCWMGQLGACSNGVGDVNGEGHNDVVVACAFDDLLEPRGQVFVYFGGPGLDSIADVTLSGYPDDMLGECIGSGSHIIEGGDLNADGFNDLILGVPRTIYTGRCGAVWILFGGPSIDSIPDLILNGHQDDDYFGQAVSCCDIDGDSDSDLIVAAPNDSMGKVYIYLGEPGIDTLADFVINEIPGLFATSGDMNGDGYSDMAVAAIYDYVFWGGPDFDIIPDIVITENTGNRLAFGDVNGDGYSDLVVGHWYSNKVYVYTTNIPGVEHPPSESRNAPSFVSLRNIPNPFSTSTTILYGLYDRGQKTAHGIAPMLKVSLTVYDVVGNRIATLVDGVQNPGYHAVLWDGRDSLGMRVPSGLYFLHLRAEDAGETRKVVLIR